MSKIKTVVIIYWALLLYIFSFIIFWVIKIEKQNKEIASLKKQIVIIQNNTHNVSPETIIEIDTMNHVRKIQFYSEGVFFLLLIFISAIFIYRNIHRVWKFNLQQKNILRILSHELKTPISIIKLNLQSLQQYELPPAETKKIISNSLNENYRIETITNNILLCNELLVDEYKVQFQEVDLNWILNKVLKKFISHPEYHTISVENIDMITILADPILIEIFLTNLIDNALKYGLKNNIEIKIKRLSHQIIFEIADQGIGIDPVNNKELFKKFSRIKNNISMKTTGTGLGLYICKLISQQHHGEFIYFPNNPTGSVFRLTLPQNK